jgi:hypothetical protein
VTGRKYYIDKRCTKMDEKLLKNLIIKKRLSITYHRTKVQKLGSPKNKRVDKT